MEIKKINRIMTLMMIYIAFCAVVIPVQAAHEVKATTENVNALSGAQWEKYSIGYLLKYSATDGISGYKTQIPFTISSTKKITAVKINEISKPLPENDGQCVAFVKAVSGQSEQTKNWIKGQKVVGGTQTIGTAIAKFGASDNHYGGHTAIMKSNPGSTINVWDQNYVATKLVGYHSMSATNYYSIEIPDTKTNVHFANTGWVNSKPEPWQIFDKSFINRMEAIQITSTQYSLKYRAHVANKGWLNWVSNGGTAGTVGENLQMEAVDISLVNPPTDTHVWYRVYYSGSWHPWVQDGADAGTTGQGIPLKGIQIYIGKGLPTGVSNFPKTS